MSTVPKKLQLLCNSMYNDVLHAFRIALKKWYEYDLDYYVDAKLVISGRHNILDCNTEIITLNYYWFANDILERTGTMQLHIKWHDYSNHERVGSWVYDCDVNYSGHIAFLEGNWMYRLVERLEKSLGETVRTFWERNGDRNE